MRRRISICRSRASGVCLSQYSFSSDSSNEPIEKAVLSIFNSSKSLSFIGLTYHFFYQRFNFFSNRPQIFFRIGFKA
jgi:hypothetical protein